MSGFRTGGAGFSVTSPRSPDDVHSLLRNNFTRWYDVRPGLRGLRFGPVYLLGWNASSESHFRILLIVRRDGFGTRIVGLFLSAAMAAVCAVLFVTPAVWAVVGLAQNSLNPIGAVPIALVAGLCAFTIVILYWRADKSGHPIVRALRQLFDPQKLQRVRPPATMGEILAAALKVSGQDRGRITAAVELLSHLERVELAQEEFVILERSESNFIQTAYDGFGFRVERRLSSDEELQVAFRRDAKDVSTFDLYEAHAILVSYLCGADEISGVTWRVL